MLKREMLESPGKILLFVFLFNVTLPCALFAETSVRSKLTLHIARNVWHNNYIEALEGAKELIRNEPFNPSGYFLLGSIYQTISEEYRTDRYKDTISLFLDSAITLAEGRKTADADNPDWYFITGASFGYRALHRAFHGNWWGAFRDGLSCSSDLNHALELDSTYYDAYLGLGAYHYYRTIKAKDFLWLPFVSDQRKQGFSEIRKAIEQGYLATYNARQTLLRMYFTEGQYDSAVALSYCPSVKYIFLRIVGRYMSPDNLAR